MKADRIRGPMIVAAIAWGASLILTGVHPWSAHAIPFTPTRDRLGAALRKVEKTPCVCNDGSAYAGRGGLIYGEAGVSGATHYFTPWCHLFEFDAVGNVAVSGPGCFPFIPLAR